MKERVGREPYQHLKSKNVFLNEAMQYEKIVRQIDCIEDQNEKIKPISKYKSMPII